MLRRVLELPAMVLIIGVTLVATEVNTEAIGAVAEAEAGGRVMIVETEVVNRREITEIDEMTEARLRNSVMIEDETDGDESLIEVGDNPRPRDEAVHQITPHAIFEIPRQAST
jgi:hypothetical protein